MISVIIPAKNEGAGLSSIIRSVKPYATEILVVDGHSNDHTASIVKRARVRYLLDHGYGRGDGVRVGLAEATCPIAVLFDADGSHEAADIPKLVAPILSGKADLVIASRRTGGSFDRRMDLDSLIRSLGADLLTMMVNHTFNVHLTDVLYSFRAIKTSSIPALQLTSNGFSIEQEMVVSALNKKMRVIEIASREHARAWSESKLRTLTGITLLIQLIRQLYL